MREALPALVDDLPGDLLVAVVDTYTAVFLDHDGQAQLEAILRAHLEGRTSSDLLATAHPSGTRMTWLDPATAISG